MLRFTIMKRIFFSLRRNYGIFSSCPHSKVFMISTLIFLLQQKTGAHWKYKIVQIQKVFSPFL